jgi:Domain of unknown function (DUF4349)
MKVLRTATLFAALIFMLLPGFSLVAEDLVHYQIDARLVVYDADAAGDELISWIESSGGYFLIRSNDYLEARLPVDLVPEIYDTLKHFAEELLDYSLSARNLSSDLARAKASLSSREEVLKRNMAFLNTADFTSTLAIEREVLQLIQEIEGLRARIAALQTHSAYAALRLRLKSEGITPAGWEASSFDWINSIDFYDFMAQAPVERAFAWLPRSGVPSEGPEGFSVYRRSVNFRAVSPEGVRIRVRLLKPEPDMDIDFWQTAVLEHLKAAGYEPRGEARRLGSAGEGGFAAMWLLPYGGEEYVYDTAFIPRGRKMMIVESAGQLQHYDRRRGEIDAWVQGLY